MKRRNFIKTGVAGAALLSMPQFAADLAAIPAAGAPYMKPVPDEDAFHVGMAGYTFVNFDLDTTIAFMQRLGVKYLCIKDFHLPLNSNAEQIAAFHAKLAEKDIKGYAVGPIYMKSKEQVDRAFDYAVRVGVKLLVAVPNYELLPYVEEKVKQTDIRIAIHLHGPDMKLYPDAEDIWNNVKDLDPRMGMCLDIGHNLRNGKDPIADLKRYKSRVFDIHLKDVTDCTKAGRGIEVGRGRIDFPRFVKMLRKVGYTGCCSLEYEKDMKDPFVGIAESIGYFRAVCDTTR